ERTYVQRHFVVERGGAAIGAADVEHPRWDRVEVPFGFIDADVLPAARDERTLSAIVGEMERRLAADGARRFGVRANDVDEVRVRAILACGFAEDRRAKRWELDLEVNGARVREMTAASRERMREAGIRILTLDQDRDPGRYRKLWRMNEEALQDVPTTLPNVEETLEETMEWLAAPDMHEDRVW